MAIERRHFDIDHIVQSYNSGEGIENIANRLNTGWGTIAKRLMRAGIKLRSRSESMLTRWRNLDEAGRKALVEPAHIAAKGRIPTKDEIRRRVNTAAAGKKFRNKVFSGLFEERVIYWLRRKGIRGIWQQPIEGYNLDIGVEPIAVEVHVAANHPLTDARLRKRTEKLRNLGWSVLYIWINISHPLLKRAVDKVISFYEFAKANPTSLGHYRVIWGTGECAPTPKSNRDYISTIPTAVNCFDPGCIHCSISGKTAQYVVDTEVIPFQPNPC